MADEVGGGELVRAAMADMHSAVVHSGVVAVVMFKLALALASRPYDEDHMRDSEVGGGRVVAGHGRA